MTHVTYLEFDSTEHVLDVPDGWSVMQGALKNGVPGIIAECLGGCACATCHVYVDPKWLAQMTPPSDNERAMMEYAEDVRDNSRLSCQLKVTPSLEGLIVRLPRTQK